MRRRVTEVAACVAAAAAALALAPAPAAAAPAVAACANPRLPPDILAGEGPVSTAAPLPVVDAQTGGVTLRLAVAADFRARELGLMCVTHPRAHAGMIFVFPASAEQEFWMKNTLVPLDMVWVAAGGTVTTVAADVPASTLRTPDDQVARRRGTGRFVIELPAGEAALDGIRPGAAVKLPPLSAAQ